MLNFFSLAIAATSLMLTPFGSEEVLLRSQNPWYGFYTEGPVLLIVRAQKIPTLNCQKWMTHFLGPYLNTLGSSLKNPLSEAEWAKSRESWQPWSEEDQKAVEGCDSFPCAVKFNLSEVLEMKKASSKQRLKTFFDLVKLRALSYFKTQERKEYEFPGNPVDPWSFLEKKGFLSTSLKPSLPSFYLRKLDFAPGKIRPIRQVLDQRSARSPSGLEATVWIRDAYTDHYFDSWGEWASISCNPPGPRAVLITQALVLELDLLKKTDVMSKMFSGKMKDAVKENGEIYLDHEFKKLRLNHN
jgi:hypothetical protein